MASVRGLVGAGEEQDRDQHRGGEGEDPPEGGAERRGQSCGGVRVRGELVLDDDEQDGAAEGCWRSPEIPQLCLLNFPTLGDTPPWSFGPGRLPLMLPVVTVR
jgi:hypothetical protein